MRKDNNIKITKNIEYILIVAGLLIKSATDVYEKCVGEMSDCGFVILTIISLVFIIAGLVMTFKNLLKK